MTTKEITPHHDKSGKIQKLPKPKKVDNAEQEQFHSAAVIQQSGLDPHLLAPQDVQQLQRTIGNRAAGQLLEGSPPALQRRELSEEDEELQLKPDIPVVGPEGGPVAPEVGAAIQGARGSGQPLEGAVQAQMGETLGHDFSDVRVHTGEQADALNQQLSARAFTTGQDLFFSEGAYEPGSSRGQELLAHELTHVVQQRSGQVRGGESGMTVRPAGDEFEQEADVIEHHHGSQTMQRFLAPQDGGLVQREVDSRESRLHGASLENLLHHTIQRKPDIKSLKKQLNKEHHGHEHLLEGIEDKMSPGKMFDVLVRNFSNRTDWRYTGPAPEFEHEGDCSSISREFVYLANKLGIKSKTETKAQRGFGLYIPSPTPIIGFDLNGNVGNQEAWFFQVGHVLVSTEDYGEVDILFRDKKLNYVYLEKQVVKEGEPESWQGDGITVVFDVVFDKKAGPISHYTYGSG